MSDSNRTKLSFVEETTWGTTPSSALQILRWTSESLKYGLSSSQSSEIRSDRNISELFLNDASVSGGFNFELSYGTYDDLIEGALWSDWAAATTGTGSGYVVNNSSGYLATDTTITLGTGSGTVLAGDIVTFAGDDNKYLVKTGLTIPGDIVIYGPGLQASLADTTAMTIEPRTEIINGVAEHYYTLEREHADVTQFFTFLGCYVNQFSLSVQAGNPITGSFDFMGKDSARGASTAGTGAATAATTSDIYTGISNVVSLIEGGSEVTGVVVKGIDFTVNNNTRSISGIGDIGAAEVGVGSCVVTGKIDMLFSNSTIYDKFLNNTASSIILWLNDDDTSDGSKGNGYIVEFPNIKYSDASLNAGGLDSDVPISVNFQALYNSDIDGCIRITKTV